MPGRRRVFRGARKHFHQLDAIPIGIVAEGESAAVGAARPELARLRLFEADAMIAEMDDDGVEIVHIYCYVPARHRLGLVANNQVKLFASKSEPDEALAARIAHRRYFAQTENLSIKMPRSCDVWPGYIVSNVVIFDYARSHGMIVTRKFRVKFAGICI
jgi:hypothetical protein